MSPNLLVVNVGSSSLKLVLLDGADEVIATGGGEGGDLDLHAEISGLLEGAGEVGLVGHRVVHGGADLTGPADLAERSVRETVARLGELAPLHNPPALRGIEVTDHLLPRIPSFACFDTAFHHDLPEVARTYALPAEWNERWNLRRYGFHGLSHAYCARRSAELLSIPARDLRLVSAHLGAGCSLAAVRDGAPVDTTMGFTPLDGLVMATRPGSLDPGLLLWVMRHEEVSAAEAEHLLENEAGLLGLSGLSGDPRELFAAADEGHAGARLAIGVFVRALAAGIAAMAAAMGGLDALAFTGGIGENSDRIRRMACERLGFLGIGLSDDSPRPDAGDGIISVPGKPVAVLRIAAREDLEIARQIRAVADSSP